MKQWLCVGLCILHLLYPILTEAKNLGVIGTVYPISETDFLEWIQLSMKEKTRHGEWQAQLASTLKSYQDRPTPVTGLTSAFQNKS